MAGYNESGTARKQLANNEARAYCEGMNARIAAPNPPNPYSAPNLAEQIAFQEGVEYVEDFVGTQVTRTDCKSCAVDTSAEVPPLP